MSKEISVWDALEKALGPASQKERPKNSVTATEFADARGLGRAHASALLNMLSRSGSFVKTTFRDPDTGKRCTAYTPSA